MEPLPGELLPFPEEEPTCGFCLLKTNLNGRLLFLSDSDCPEHGLAYGSGSIEKEY